MLELQNVAKTYTGPDGSSAFAVRDLNLTIRAGETHCLLGTSGCGKTTTLRMVNRLVVPTEGRVLLGGEDVAELDAIKLRRRVGYVIQSGGLFPHMTVARNIGVMCELEGWPVPKIEARAHELLDLLNLKPEEFATRYPGELSGGERQRVGVARALALDPAHLLMDEPFGALDPITKRQVHAEFQRLQQDVQKTILLVTHDLTEAFRLGDRVTLMHEGRVIQTGTETELRQQPAGPFVEEFLDAHVTGSGECSAES